MTKIISDTAWEENAVQQFNGQECKYTIRVTLNDSPVPIWRKFEIPSKAKLDILGEVIMDMMGWGLFRSHINRFKASGDYFVTEEVSKYLFGEELIQEEYSIDELLDKKGKTIKFEYDLGDGWEYDVRLSAISEYLPDEEHVIKFLGGKGACPPEDCGGVWGYGELLGILRKWQSGENLEKEEMEWMEWAGWEKDYDPEFVDTDFMHSVCRTFDL